MKKVLSLLLIFVFLNTTLWAYPPNYSGSGSVANLTGTYAGVFVPTNLKAGSSAAAAASLGIFAVGIPNSAQGTVLSQGAGVLFASGAGYNLSITGVFDPKASQLSAVIFGQSNFTYSVTTFPGGVATVTVYSVEAEGSMTGTISQPDGNSALNGPGTANAARINGNATIDTFSQVNAAGPVIGGTVTFSVNGFQQSATYSVPTLTIPVTGG